MKPFQYRCWYMDQNVGIWKKDERRILNAEMAWL